MDCPKCSGFLESTLVYNGTHHEKQMRCLNCGLYIRDRVEDPPCLGCGKLVCGCWGKKKSKEKEREEVLNENN